ncbi:MAG TPA: hypothetical protein PKX07_02860, partial [Aggregatilineales bacterium]|nr:hypothetical protein [Aggregatilineales bacterium]
MNTVHLDTVYQYRHQPTPTLFLDFEQINETYTRFETLFNGGRVFYAVKANSNAAICELVVRRGGGLEIASLAELE